MQQFFLEYGLFLAEFLTIMGALVLVAMLVGGLLAARGQSKESIEIENLNEKFEALQDALESELLPAAVYKKVRKIREKERKKQEKEDVNKLGEQLKLQKTREGAGELDTSLPIEQRPRLFVVRFQGDMEASDVEHLRQSISAILQVATLQDEVLVLLESAGGLVHHYGLAAAQLQRIREKGLQLTISVDLVAASGGYMMAVVGHRVIASPFAVVGSIGVFAQLPNFNRLLEKHDVDIEQHTAGEHKATLTMLGRVTEKGRQKFKQELEETHGLFKHFIHLFRPSLDLKQLGTGEHWYAQQALGLGLIDAIQTSDDYLLEQLKHKDLYQVRYVVQTSIRLRVSNWLDDFLSRMVQRAMVKLGQMRPY